MTANLAGMPLIKYVIQPVEVRNNQQITCVLTLFF